MENDLHRIATSLPAKKLSDIGTPIQQEEDIHSMMTERGNTKIFRKIQAARINNSKIEDEFGGLSLFENPIAKVDTLYHPHTTAQGVITQHD